MEARRLKDMNLMDDFLFWTLMAHEEFGPKAARYMLSTILQQPLGEVDVHAQKVLYGWKMTQHGIRMDAYIKEHDSPDVSGSFYDLEAEKGEKSKDNLPFRTRYYHNMIDNRCLKAGDDYTNLRHAYVIMITSFDPFDRNRMMYTVKNRCIEEPDLAYEDGAYTIYLYVSGDPDGLPEDLVQLLRYMKSTTSDNATGSLSALHKMVEELKQDREVQKAEMHFHEMIQYEREQAREIGLEEGRAAGLEEGRAAGLEEGRAAGLEEGRAAGHAAGLEEGRAAGLEEGRAAGLEEGREEERKKTLLEKERADKAEQYAAELEKQLAARKRKIEYVNCK